MLKLDLGKWSGASGNLGLRGRVSQVAKIRKYTRSEEAEGVPSRHIRTRHKQRPGWLEWVCPLLLSLLPCCSVERLP